MKKLLIILLTFISFIYAKQYSIIAFSTKEYNYKTAYNFIKRFPNGVVKQYSKFVEYKIEPFKTYNLAKAFLPKVKKYYKYPLIIKYNPKLGKVIFSSKNINNNINITSSKKTNPNVKNNLLIKCKTECGCKEKNKNSWEINKTQVLNDINITIKKYVFNNTSINQNNQTKEVNDTNSSTSNNICKPALSDYMFYFDLYGNVYQKQKQTKNISGNDENAKIGFTYKKYFLNNWKFFTDDRIIFARNQINSSSSSKIYFDINELYIRSYCLLNNNANILIGRKKTKDFRSWWYDAPLDEIKLFNENNLLTYQLILATRLNDETITDNNSPKDKLKNSKFLIFHVNYEYLYRKNVGGYYIYEDSKPDSSTHRKISFIGFDSNIKTDKLYWLNLSLNNGDIYYNNIKNHQNGLGLDIGLKIPYSNNLDIAGSFAYASKNFTQPYIATNYSSYLVNNFNFKYYGNVFNPTLQNINIISLYGIYYLDPMSSFITSLHNYSQNKKTKTIYNDKYVYSSNGKNTNLGNELDCVYQYLTTNKYNKLKIGGGIFLGGDAYNYLKNKNAYRLFINYRHYWK